MLFGLPFFLVGVGLLFWSVIPTLYDGWRMQSWSSVNGQLTYADLKVNHSSDSTTYGVEARYRYSVLGQQFSHDRPAINSGSDNMGDFQEQLGRSLERLYSSRQPVTVFYDPENPRDAILNRDIRWELLGFKMIFVLVFGGVGAGLVYWGFRGKKTLQVDDPEATPWLTRPEWKDGVVRSDARGGMIGMWVFASIWNLISAPLAFKFPELWDDEGAVALLALLFPAVGLGLVYLAVRFTRQWKRFGITPLTMDPFPGSVGGDVGGVIRVGVKYQSDMACRVTLSNIYSYVTGSGKNRSRSERVEWQDDGYAKIIAYADGVGLQFRFELPEGLKESEEHSDRYHFWRLNVVLEMEGTDLDRNFEIPVYQTGGRSRHIQINSSKELPGGTAAIRATDLLPVVSQANPVEWYYPMLRKPGRSLVGLIFGGVFAGAGVFLWGEAATEGFMLYMMSSVFSLVGWGIVLGAIWSAFNSLRVTLQNNTVIASRAFLGVPVGRHVFEYGDILGIEASEGMKSQSGNKHHIEYSVIARIPGRKVTLVQHLDSASKKNLVIEYLREQLQSSGSRFEIE